MNGYFNLVKGKAASTHAYKLGYEIKIEYVSI